MQQIHSGFTGMRHLIASTSMLFRSTQRSSENLETRSEFRTTSRCGDSPPTYDTVRRLEEKMTTDVWTSGSSRDAMMELNEESIGGNTPCSE